MLRRSVAEPCILPIGRGSPRKLGRLKRALAIVLAVVAGPICTLTPLLARCVNPACACLRASHGAPARLTMGRLLSQHIRSDAQPLRAAPRARHVGARRQCAGDAPRPRLAVLALGNPPGCHTLCYGSCIARESAVAAPAARRGRRALSARCSNCRSSRGHLRAERRPHGQSDNRALCDVRGACEGLPHACMGPPRRSVRASRWLRLQAVRGQHVATLARAAAPRAPTRARATRGVRTRAAGVRCGAERSQPLSILAVYRGVLRAV